MSRFATKMAITPKRVKAPVAAAKKAAAPTVSRARPTTVNDAGGEAYNLSLRSEIVSTILNSMLKGGFHKDASGELTRIQELVEKADKAGDLEFLAKAALFARHVHGLRTVTHVIAGELGDRARGEAWKRHFYRNIVYRPDDLLEILGYWNLRHDGFRHPNPMIRGFAERLAGMNAYGLAKYKGDGKSVSMIDAINICHPRVPKGHPIHKLMKGKLEAAETWEKELSEAGNAGEEGSDRSEAVAEAKSDAWTKLLSEGKLNYLACLRNLRNIVEQAPEALDMALALLVDPAEAAKSKVFPFQFRTAYEELKGKAKVRAAIVKAAELTLVNVPKFDGRTLVVVDDSGSMTSGGDNACSKIAALFASVLLKANPEADYIQFNSQARYVEVDTVGLGLFALAESIERQCQNGGTNFTSIFQTAHAGYDRIIILSDMQGWMEGGTQSAFAAYAKKSKKVPYLYSFNLSAQGTSQFPEKQICLLSGFSERIFETMGRVEQDPKALVHEVEKVDIVKGIPKK